MGVHLDADGRVVTYRRLGVAWFLALCWIAVALIGIGVAASGSTGNGAFGVILAATSAWLVVRTLRQAVVVKPDELVIRNLTRTVRVPWDQIRSVEQPPPFPTYWRGGLQVHLQTGRTVSASAYSRSGWSRDDLAADVIRCLRDRIGQPSSAR